MMYERHYDDNNLLLQQSLWYDENGLVTTPHVITDTVCGSTRTRWYDRGYLLKSQVDGTIHYYDEDYNIHNDDGPAVIYGDGVKVYMIHGVFQKRETGDPVSDYYKNLYKSLPVEDKRDKK